MKGRGMGLRTESMIEITGCDLAALVRAVYSLSRQQGLGLFDGNGRGGISDEDVAKIIERGREDRMCAVSMDYWNGRSIKMTVYKDGDRLFINNRWYDHSDSELGALLESIGLSADAIGHSRERQEAYRETSKVAALAFLRERGGQFRQNRGLRSHPKPEEVLPRNIEDGLFSALSDKLVIEKWCDDGTSLWTIAN